MTLSTFRKSISPQADDNWHSIAQRELGDLETEQAVQQLQSWNLHVFMRPNRNAADGEEANPIMPSDVIFVEAPLVN